MRARLIFAVAMVGLGVSALMWAQQTTASHKGGKKSTAPDAVTADPKHYKVETENAEVRVLRIHYGPHEKSVMHSHPDSVAVFLTDINGQFTFPDGRTEKINSKAGDVQFTPAGVHLPENLSDKPFELVLVELKGHGKSSAAAGSAGGTENSGGSKKGKK
jgi:quercetin dioxygenase-like cupin family protein